METGLQGDVDGNPRQGRKYPQIVAHMLLCVALASEVAVTQFLMVFEAVASQVPVVTTLVP